MDSPKVFLRNATGLRREFGVLDTIWINLSLVGIIFSLTFISSTAPLVGGDPIQGGLLALVAMFFGLFRFNGSFIHGNYNHDN
jgi:hypothetical protein